MKRFKNKTKKICRAEGSTLLLYTKVEQIKKPYIKLWGKVKFLNKEEYNKALEMGLQIY